MTGAARIALAVITLAIPVGAQTSMATQVVEFHATPARVAVPFRIGERAEYSLKYGIIPAGTGVTEVLAMDSIRGRETWHTLFRIVGGVWGYSINDRFESWIDTHTFSSLRHRQEQQEGSRERERQFEIYPDKKVFVENDHDPAPTVDEPLDDGSFLYFIRTIPLEVGKEYSFDRYFRPDRNPVRIIVLRREQVTVPAGTFNCIVVRPIIKTKGVFSENGRAEVWITDDSAKLLVQIKSHLVFGSLNLYLKSYRPATIKGLAATGGAVKKKLSKPAKRAAIREADLSRVRTVPVANRANKVSSSEFAKVPGKDRSFHAFLESLPDILVARDFLRVVDAIVAAHKEQRAVVVMLGGHIVKTGITPLLVTLMERGVITHVAMNGSAAIHDYEMARFPGGTSEDVAAGLKSGTFGMAEETGREMNEAFTRGSKEKRGMGESLGMALDSAKLAHPELSVLLAAHTRGVPATVHAALGAEIIHQHPAADGAAIGDTSHRDFRRLAASLDDLHDGGVVLNLGSAVIMPEVFLKALTIARNLNHGRPQNFVTCDLDMIKHYRPTVNVVQRPTLQSGKGYQITGHHELMVPMLVWAVLDRLG